MYQNNSDLKKIDLMKYFDRFFRTIFNLWKAVLILLLIGVLVFEMKEVLFFNITYTSEAVFVPSISIDDLYDQGTNQSYIKNQLISTFNSIITSKEMDDVIKEVLHVKKVPATISAAQVENTNLVVLKVTSKSAKDAYHVASAVVNNYDRITNSVMSDVNITLLDEPSLPKNADEYPNYMQAAKKGILVGSSISLFLLIIVAILRKTIIDKNDVTDVLGMNYITKIPFIEFKEKYKTNNLALSLKSPGVRVDFKNAFQNIKIKIEQEHRMNKNSVYMVTSTVPNEGKTMISVNTAMILGMKGYKVCLVDLDVRNPSVEKTMHHPYKGKNVLDFLKDNNITLEQCITTVDDIDVLFGDDVSVDGSTGLSKKRLNNLIEQLRENYDFVILDVSPLYVMEDALLVAKHVDSTIVVVKQDYALVSDILDSVDELNKVVENITGVVINGYNRSFFQSESTSSYGYSYGGK